ncbi:cyclic pyranopterin monophosphate synthase MoaC [Qipengyuania sp. 6B39]|uniref:cyclic pyranopterin monophosphate synthase MoaC n=1 Tax=Qipengyuania proteolytica TaxID=2867239 RepID=UPI001C8ADCA3|nr:cyclic pyranopterin monophosphate synthase MoaC [Qipengyuania proteolytica]MBX7495165.1 cyclic pyranopterin monophosphate synthase MoaC [Qipengyuania proteolytica]
MSKLSHLDAAGRARMVDVSAKADTRRRAIASGQLVCALATLEAVSEGRTPKGAVISTAELAGVMAAKRTAELIPLCHPLPLAKIAVSIAPDSTLPGFIIEAEAVTTGPTGVEMEALTAVSVAGLTLFDMLKAIDRGMVIGAIQVKAKTGGVGGDWARDSESGG